MKRIVICFDGTWNKPADESLPADQQIETNVCRFYKSIKDTAADGIRQVKWYDEGVGTKWYDRFIGGAMGVGLEKNILDGYKFLAKEYQEGDEVYILGFSRGAYTARSLAGLIRNCGLVKNKQLTLRTAMAYGIYRTRDDGPDSSTALEFKAKFSREIKIKFLGVWDTVGALGIPLDTLQRLNMHFYEFHDTRLSHIVENAYHAVAIDEHRIDYDACLWTPDVKPEQNLEQRWFVGAHSDIGGGYRDRRLSDVTLRWIQDKAMAADLAITPINVRGDNYLGVFTDSYMQFLNGIYARNNPRHYRAIGSVEFGNEIVDDSVQRRRKEDRDYKPRNNGLPPLQ
ncbi:DUF2235 domain-containing protein [Methylocaldum sp.]|uniref:DUF2235 domain-containing protein n=1 Tax=Methylocaldum sp. TaxID=1969727 RepID=UPI002D24A65A|nr:DUF2235 domain-containing protein [Methylocaldum sp.]HYE33982.1 DUF2235 domain-containing protein [Methylocaldum sp.]